MDVNRIYTCPRRTYLSWLVSSFYQNFSPTDVDMTCASGKMTTFTLPLDPSQPWCPAFIGHKDYGFISCRRDWCPCKRTSYHPFSILKYTEVYDLKPLIRQ